MEGDYSEVTSRAIRERVCVKTGAATKRVDMAYVDCEIRESGIIGRALLPARERRDDLITRVAERREDHASCAQCTIVRLPRFTSSRWPSRRTSGSVHAPPTHTRENF